MLEIIRVTNNNAAYFLQMLPPYENRLLKQDKEVFALGAVEDETACGVLLCRHQGCLLDILYLAVGDNFRRKGVGTGLLQFLCRLAAGKNLPVSCCFSIAEDCTDREQDVFYSFFEHQRNFCIFQNEQVRSYAIPVDRIMTSVVLNRPNKTCHAASLFFDLPEGEQRAFLQKLTAAGIHFLDDYSQMKESCIREVCFAEIANREIRAALFFAKCDDEADVRLTFAYSTKAGIRELLAEFRQAGAYLCTHYPGTGRVLVDTVNTASRELLLKLYPDSILIDNRMFTADWNMLQGGV